MRNQAVIVIEFEDGRTVLAKVISFGMFSIECSVVKEPGMEPGTVYFMNKHSIRRMWRAPAGW